MLIESSIVEEVKGHVKQILSNHLPEYMTYHSIHHTMDVVNSANEIVEKQNLSGEEVEIVNIAAWFHDVGYAYGGENHEERSAKLAQDFLEKHSYPTDKIQKVVGCILSTKMPQDPQNNLEQILCDADLMHLADEDYFRKADLLHKEIEQTKLCKIPENEWLQMNHEFLNNHCFFTEYAKSNYESAVKENLRKVRERLKTWKKTKK